LRYSLNVAAPSNSPTASPNVPPFNAANVEKTSGLPFPNARKVTPAVDSLSPSTDAIVARFGQKKSDAQIPIKEKRKPRMRTIAKAIKGLEVGDAEKYQSL
jgi:hypothetical protein